MSPSSVPSLVSGKYTWEYAGGWGLGAWSWRAQGSLSREEAGPAGGWGTAGVARAWARPGLVTKGKTEGFGGCWNSCHILLKLMQKKSELYGQKKKRSDKWTVDKAFVFRRQFVHTYLLETLWHLNTICVGIPRFIILLRYSVFCMLEVFGSCVLSDDGEHF